MNLEQLKQSVRNIPDYPAKGVQFKDLTTVFKQANELNYVSQELKKQFEKKGVTKVVGLESRGFIMGPILARDLNAGFIPIRKPGKLPAETYQETYTKEYGYDTIEIHKDAIEEDDIVVIHDDLLATGGTMLAAYKLVKRFNPKKIYISTIVELDYLDGKKHFDAELEIYTLIHY